MKILLYGELWEGTHIDSISKELKQLKIDYRTFDFLPYVEYATPSKLLNKVFRRVFRKINRKKINNELINEIKLYKPTSFLISKGIDIYPETLLKIKDFDIKIINWNPDDFFNKKNTNINILNSLKIYDVVFSARKHLFQEYKKRGIKNPIYLEWYYIPYLHKKINQNIPEDKKLTFVGTYSERRDNIISSIDVINVEIWGYGWEKSKAIKKHNIMSHNKILNQTSFPDVMAKSLINLNILTKENRDNTNLKIFEIVASGGTILTEKNNISKKILGADSFYFHDTTDINEIIQKIINHSFEQLKTKKDNTHQKIVLDNNSISDRVSQMIKYIK